MKRALSMILALLFCLFSLCGCEQEEKVEWRNSTPSMNCITASGCFAYRDDFIYFADTRNLYEYDMVSGKTVILYETSKFDFVKPKDLHVTEDRIYCNMGGLNYITRDGKKREKLYSEHEGGGCWYLYMDGTDVYYRDVIRNDDGTGHSALCRRDLETGEEEVLFGNGNVYSYAVGPDKIYVVEEIEPIREHALYVSDKEKVDFQKVALPETIVPVNAYPVEEGAYFNVAWKDWKNATRIPNLYWWQDGKVEELSIPSGGPRYHVIGNKMIYQDTTTRSKTRSQSAMSLCIRDLETGETTVVDDSTFYYAVLEERYVCYWRPDEVHQQWYYYDLQTGQTTLMYEILDSMALYSYSIG